LVAKFTIIIAAVAFTMIALILVPRLNTSDDDAANQSQLNLQYSKQNLTRDDAGSLVAASAEVLVIRNDGGATYTKIIGSQSEERSFTLGDEDLKRIRALILGTGFTNIPDADYVAKPGLANFTKYSLKIEVNDKTRTISWVNPEFHDGAVPPIITNAGSLLDDIISRYRR
jgi:type II secretory pathway pseudopilin PulG